MKNFQIISLLFFLFLAFPLAAQNFEDDPEQYDDVVQQFADVFTEEYLDKKDEKLEEKAFGSEDEKENEDAEEFEDMVYNLSFVIETEVTFADLESGLAHTSIKYVTTIQNEITITTSRWRETLPATIETETVGAFASNQFFTCDLLVEVEQVDADIMTRLNLSKNEDEDEPNELAIQIKFDKKYKEDWYSNCTGIDDSTLNTIAADSPETYNLEIINLLEPSLNATLIDNFVIGDDFTVEFDAEDFEYEDLDTNKIITLSGSAVMIGTFVK